ncbi:unnamed protein product [Diatraea saccharalis]|uniref:MPN domain-containing protein n=1 Tax=Diatraea saccharalis TaxID=40085 RepID=A0A9N9WI76_9NEOP|nr:unnamed protein product [Diatraea saccharalis]
MGEVTMQTVAYAKIILHAAKYPHCAVNGILLADGTKIKEGAKNQDLDIVDSIPLFHHSHYVSPMAEVALTQIETMAQADNRIIAGFYAACENYRDNTVDKCPGQKIAEKIAEYFPSAVFIVVDNKRIVQHLDTPALKLHKHAEGKWKPKEINKHIFLRKSLVAKFFTFHIDMFFFGRFNNEYLYIKSFCGTVGIIKFKCVIFFSSGSICLRNYINVPSEISFCRSY